MNKRALIPELDDQSPVALYHQITLHLQKLIQDGVLAPGDQLPSERLLAESAGVSRMTVRQAVRAMIMEGYCERVRGRGIYVRKRPVIVDPHRFEGFTANMRREGRVAETRSLSSRLAIPPAVVSEKLEVPANEQAVELVRLRVINGVPAVLETEWFPASRFAGLVDEDMSKSLYGILERGFGVKLASTTDVIHAYLPTPSECELLHIPAGLPVILRDRVGRTAEGEPIEVVRSVYHPEQYEFRMNLVPAPMPADQIAVEQPRTPPVVANDQSAAPGPT